MLPKLKNKKKLTYLREAKGYLTLKIPGIVSIDHVHSQSKSITKYHEAYAVDTLKVEIEAVKGRKMSFSHSYYNLLRFFRKMAVTSILILEPDRVRKDVLVVACLAIFIFSVVSYGL